MAKCNTTAEPVADGVIVGLGIAIAPLPAIQDRLYETKKHKEKYRSSFLVFLRMAISYKNS